MLVFDPLAPFDSVFGRTAGRATGLMAPIDVTVSAGDLVVTMDVPGVTPDKLDIQVLGGDLVVRGERTRPQLAENTSWAHAERPFGTFERRIRLPEGVDPDGITASFEHGVLSLIVPKPERMKPRRIEIGGTGERKELAGSVS